MLPQLPSQKNKGLKLTHNFKEQALLSFVGGMIFFF